MTDIDADAETDTDASRDEPDERAAETNERAAETDEYVGEYDKLVRDDIPAVVRDDGKEPVTRTVDGVEYRRYLARKLREEVDEVVDALEAEGEDASALDADGAADGADARARDDVLDELADVHAVLDAVAATSGCSMPAVRDRAAEKADDRGAFADGVVLERIDPDE